MDETSNPIDLADIMARHHQNAKHPQRCAACLMSWPCRMYQLAKLAQEHAAAALPDPKHGCACHFHGSDPLSGPPDVEYSPACPVHSEHVYDPRQGRWIFADPAKNAAWESERRARRAERAHGMDRESRERTNALIHSLDLPTGRRSAPTDRGLSEG